MSAAERHIEDSQADRAVRRWLESIETSCRPAAEGADLFYEGAGPAGPVRVAALSPFRPEPGVSAISAPALVRAEVGLASGPPTAWAPARLPGGDLALYAAAEGWCGAVLHTNASPPLEGSSEPGAAYGEALSPCPHVFAFLARLTDLVRAEPEQRRAALARESEAAAVALGGLDHGGLGRAVVRARGLAAYLGFGAAVGGAAVGSLGLASPVGFLSAVGLGLLGGAGLGAIRVASTVRTRLLPATRAVVDGLEAAGVFDSVSLAPESPIRWPAPLLVESASRDVVSGALRADNRVEAVARSEDLRLVVDVFALSDPPESHEQARLVPATWLVARVRAARPAALPGLGRLLPVGGELVGWFAAAELGSGAFDDELLGPLGRWLRQGASRPYR